MANGISDIGARVYILETGSYDFLFSCSDIGAIGGSVDKHESTCTDDTAKTYVIGRRDTPEVEFSYNYTEANAVKVQGKMDGATPQELLVVYGDGSGYYLKGVGTDSTDALGTNSLHKATFTFVQMQAAQFKTADEMTGLLP